MRRCTRWLAVGVLCLAMVACVEEPNPGWDRPIAHDGPVSMEHGLVYLDRNVGEVIVLRTEPGAQLLVERAATGDEPSYMEVSQDRRQLYVVSRRDQTLDVFDILEDSVERSTVELGSYYDQLTVDPHGEFVLLSNSGQDSEAVIQNVNEVGIVDLRGGVPEELAVVTLPTRANNLHLLAPFEFSSGPLEGETQRLAVALSTNNITLLDLNAEERRNQVRRAPLSSSAADDLEPVRVVFDGPTDSRPNRASLFVLDNRGDDVTQVVIQPSLNQENRKLDLSLNQLAAGRSPQLVEILELRSGTDQTVNRLLALDGDRPEFTLVDVDSGEAVTFDLPMSQAATGMEVYRVPVPGQGRTELRVLVYARGSSLVAVIRPEEIAVGSDTPTLGQAVTERRLSASVHEVILDGGTDQNRAVILHSGGNDGLSVFNLESSESWWLSGFNPSQVIFDGSFGYGIFDNTSHMVRVNLESGQARAFELPDRAQEIFLSPDNESVLIRHQGRSGRFTLLERANLEPESARLYEHVFLSGALNWEVADE